jgi:F-type H+-transporting ATPase subunit a
MIATVLLAAALAGQAAPAHEPPATAPAVEQASPAGHEAEGHEGPSEILMHHVMDRPIGPAFDLGPLHLQLTRHLAFFLVAAAVVLVIARLAIRSYREGIPTGIGAAVETLVVYVRDEIAERNIGHGDGAKYTPLLLSFFFFILFAALIGLLPFSATSTGNISVTMGLAVVAFLAMQLAGISKYGVVHHFTNMIPAGLPAWLLPIIIPVELLGMFSKPFALMIRLFANMLAGHMVITTLLLLIPLMSAIGLVFGVPMIPISLLLALFIMTLEVLVAFIQAYVFTLLTSIFIGMSAHPAH